MPQSVTTQAPDLNALAFDLAQNRAGENLPVGEILARHNITAAQLHSLMQSPAFSKALHGYAKELRENGASFRLKARIQAEELLKSNWKIIHDPATPPGVAVKAIENTVRWADLEPRKDMDTSSRPAITVNIDLGTVQESVVIDATQLQSPADSRAIPAK